jgi:DNA polymerase-3 subunit chi
MSRVDFYVLPDAGESARQRFACRLAEKAYSLDNSVHIRVADQRTAALLDDLLWTFRDGSFVPHELVSSADVKVRSPITIGHHGGAARACDLLINLTESIPDDTGSIPRVAEIVSSDEPSRQLSRKRFVEYRDGGHTLESHNL